MYCSQASQNFPRHQQVSDFSILIELEIELLLLITLWVGKKTPILVVQSIRGD